MCRLDSWIARSAQIPRKRAPLAAQRNVVFTKDVAAGKPAPDIYVEAARRIGVEPRFCRAYEDGESGLIATTTDRATTTEHNNNTCYRLPDRARAARVKLPGLGV